MYEISQEKATDNMPKKNLNGPGGGDIVSRKMSPKKNVGIGMPGRNPGRSAERGTMRPAVMPASRTMGGLLGKAGQYINNLYKTY